MTTTTVATAKDRYLAEFQALEGQGVFRSPSWLAPLRRDLAVARFASVGGPGPKSHQSAPNTSRALMPRMHR